MTAAPEAETVARLVRRTTVTPGTVLIREGEPADALYVVVSGSLRVTHGGRAVGSLGAGDAFGEALIFREPRSATVVTETETVLEVIEAPALRVLLGRAPAYSSRMLASIAGRLHP